MQLAELIAKRATQQATHCCANPSLKFIPKQKQSVIKKQPTCPLFKSVLVF